MNWPMIAALVALATLFLVITGGIWMGGKMAQRQEYHGISIADHGRWLQRHDETLERHATKLAQTEAWRQGYSAASGANQRQRGISDDAEN